MKDVLEKRDRLYRDSTTTKHLKFNFKLVNNKEKVTRLINEHQELYNQYLFYRGFLKAYEKEKRR